MKHLLIPALTFFLSFSAFGQQEFFYYYQKEKIYLKLNDKKILVRARIKSESLSLKNKLNSKELIVNEKQSALNHIVLDLNSVSKTRSKRILDSLNLKSEIDFANFMLTTSDSSVVGYTDQFAVKLLASTSMREFEKLAYETKSIILKENEFVKNQFLLSVGKNSKLNTLEMANYFFETGLFEFSEPDFYLVNITHTNDTQYGNQWGLKNTGQYSGVAGNDISVEAAWAITKGRPDVVIAVVDEGVDLIHPDLAANLLPGFDATGYGSQGGATGNDAHGTACAGIIAAIADNGRDIAGIAPNCKILPVRSLVNGNGLVQDLEAGINSAWQGGADIISNSWGLPSPFGGITNAINAAVTNGRNGLGCIVLFAVGNSNSAISYPAYLPNVIAVGAISMCNERKRSYNQQSWIDDIFNGCLQNPHTFADPNGVSCDGERCWGSNYGPELDVVAPGVKIATLDISGGAGYSANDYVLDFNGTSSACPHAAGVVALVLSANRCLTQAQASSILQLSTDKPGNYCYNRTSGYPNGGWNNEMGYGRINAYKAVQYAFSSQISNSTNLTGTDQGPVGFYSWILTGGCSGIAAASYLVKRHEVQSNVTYPSLDAPSIIVTSNGFSINNPNDGRYWASAKNITTTNATLYSYTYEVTNILGQTLGWIPVSPGNMRFDYSAVNAMAADLYFQNQSVTSSLAQNSMTKIEAGMNVTASLPQGNYTVLPGADITFHAANSVILRAGMEVKNGALFKATADRFFKCTQYPNGRIGNKNEIHPEKSPISGYESTYVPDLLSQEDGITVYPNPFSSNFAVAYSIKAASAVVISVHDITGTEVARFESNGPLETGSYQLQIDAGNLVSGIYVLKFVSGEHTNALKIIKK